MVRRVMGVGARGGLQLAVLLVVASGCNCNEGQLVSLRDEEPGTPEAITDDSDDCFDEDGDGFGVGPGCEVFDCNDADPNVGAHAERGCYSGPEGTSGVGACVSGKQTCTDGQWSEACVGEALPVAEVCDAVDNDCDGTVDEELAPRACYTGPAGTEGVGACLGGQQVCTAGAWSECAGEVLPQPESCDGVDSDCDGQVDEELVRTCYDGPAGTAGVGTCAEGTQTCAAGAWGACTGAVLPSLETCDAVDNNCDGTTDEALVRSCYGGPVGTDGVGVCHAGTETCSAGIWGACTGQVVPAAEACDGIDNNCNGSVDEALVRGCYAGPAGTAGVGACSQGTQTCTAGAWDACRSQVLPAAEICDGVDNDCDGAVDEGLVRSCYDGPASTPGIGACAGGSSTCSAGTWGACVGEVLPTAETCDGVDNDCDGAVDEALLRRCYAGPAGTAGVGVCADGVQTCSAGTWGSCDGQVLPAAETCDARDNDCDGTVDESLVRSCYDGPQNTSGVGLCAGGTQTCSAGAWGTCDGQILPAAETCDAQDNDCDGAVDEALVRSCYTGPAGTEGVGACAAGTETCAVGTWGACVGDVVPKAEVCDAVDNDCNGVTDEGLTRSCYPGAPGTLGVGVCAAGTQQCASGAWGACEGAVVPQTETCDTADNDCNGSTDENVTRYGQSGSNQPLVPRYRPVDIIFVIDNSSSMADEIAAVEQNINVNFAQIIGASGLDYRVILIAQYGDALGEVCVLAPLGGQTVCGVSGTCPVNGKRFFHYNVPVGSHDSFHKIVTTYGAPDTCGLAPNGWSGWLRKGATKYFVEITDDEPFVQDPTKPPNPNSYDAAWFDSHLLALSSLQFGTADDRNFVFHSIIGLHENDPVLAPWLPTDPLVKSLCTGNGGFVRTAGVEYQKESILTGGFRYPICEYQDFDAVFTRLAQSITDGQQIACSFTLESIPADSSLENTVLEYTPTTGGAPVPLTHVSGPDACTDNAFYTVDGEIVLCPEACSVWREDPTAEMDVLFYCTNQIQP